MGRGSRHHRGPVPHLPRSRGGLVGYFGYEAVKEAEHKLATPPSNLPDDVPQHQDARQF
ncbi:MAG: hypothetical protein IT361_07465 [Gemmatimonadaceae bacterium]|nr:hypothetical protein [Gemmatimonadaceae bacterium]